MSPEKVWAALAGYDTDLERLGYVVWQFTPAEYAAKGVPLAAVLAHCRWMARKCLSAFKAEYEAAWRALTSGLGKPPQPADVVEALKPLEKAMRWLAYIQGACHAFGLYSCDELRDHSRGGEGEFKPADEEHAARRYALVGEPSLRSSEHRLTLTAAGDMPLFTAEQAAQYEAYDREHMGDADKGTGIHHPDASARRAAARAAVVAALDARRVAVAAALDACFCTDQHSPGVSECGNCVALRAELAELDAGGA